METKLRLLVLLFASIWIQIEAKSNNDELTFCFSEKFEKTTEFANRWKSEEGSKLQRLSIHDSFESELESVASRINHYLVFNQTGTQEIWTTFEKPCNFSKVLVIQYLVRFGPGRCGKCVLHLSDAEQNFWLSFGPKGCGSSTQLIFSIGTPMSEMDWKHREKYKKLLSVFADFKWHMFTLVIHDGVDYRVILDETEIFSGKILNDFERRKKTDGEDLADSFIAKHLSGAKLSIEASAPEGDVKVTNIFIANNVSFLDDSLKEWEETFSFQHKTRGQYFKENLLLWILYAIYVSIFILLYLHQIADPEYVATFKRKLCFWTRKREKED